MELYYMNTYIIYILYIYYIYIYNKKDNKINIMIICLARDQLIRLVNP